MAQLKQNLPTSAGPLNAHLVLVEPLIPGNAGSLARVCAGTHTCLHLVEPLGFSLDDRHLKRAGLDYWPNVMWRTHPSTASILNDVPRDSLFFYTAQAEQTYTDVQYPSRPWLFFGSETMGLPDELLKEYSDRCYRVPVTSHIRSLNLAAVATTVLYEVLRQHGYPDIDR